MSEAQGLLAASEARAALTWAEVRAYLKADPRRLHEDPALMAHLGLRPHGPNVIDFVPAALARKAMEHDKALSAQRRLEQLARANFEAQAQCHEAVLELLEARNLSDLARRVDDAARSRFGLVGAVIAIEGPGRVPIGWRFLEDGVCDYLLGDGGAASLGPVVGAEPLFEALADKVKSTAAVRLTLWSPPRDALLVLGSPDPDGFTADMGAELVSFLARVVERTAMRWPAS